VAKSEQAQESVPQVSITRDHLKSALLEVQSAPQRAF
jgi:hypothetical protein